MVIVLNVAGCSKKEKTKYEASFLELFDTVTQIMAYTDTKEEFTEFAQFIYDNLEEYHQLFDIYNDYDGINNIKTINENAGIKPVKVDRKIIDLLLFAKEAYNITDGMVNVAFGSVLSIWHDYRTEGIDDPEHAELPPMEDLKKASNHTNIDDVIIDEDNSTVYLEDPDMSLDVGAIAKGYAVEAVSDIAFDHGYTNALISVGGNVRAIGDKGDNKGKWNVGVQNPDMDSEEKNLYILNLSDKSLVTSGSYQRYYTVDGKQYHHIIDPSTLMPSEYFTAVTIVCEDSGMADALSTGVYNMSYEDGLKLIESQPDAEALWVFPNGDIKFSSYFKDFIKE